MDSPQSQAITRTTFMAVAVSRLLEMRPCQPNVPTLPEIKAPGALREAALHPRPQGVLGFELRGLLPLACGLEGLVMGLGPDGQLPGGVSG